MNKTICIECGSAQVNHRSEWWSNWFEHWSGTYSKPLEYIRRKVQPAISYLPWNSLGIFIIKTGAILGAIQISNELLPTDNSRTISLWNSAQPRGITIQRIKIFGRQTEISIAQHKAKKRLYMSMPRPQQPPSNSYFWMDNKSEMQIYFTAAGIPVPKSFECRTEEQALKAFRQINSTVIVKPTYGSRSRHTIVNIKNEQDLIRSFRIAQQISPWVMVQEELPGMVHRVLWVGNKVVAVMRREPAYVVGDGVLTVQQLVEKENKNPLRQGPIFHHLPTNEEATQELVRQNKKWESVPAKGEIIVINPKVSRGNGAVNVDVTDETHPENMELFKKIGSFLNDPLVGIDFIIRDITKPWTEQLPCGVIECNALPYVDLHSYPYSGAVRDAAGALWELVFPESKLTQS